MKKLCAVCKREVNETIHTEKTYIVDYFNQRTLVNNLPVDTVYCRECFTKQIKKK